MIDPKQIMAIVTSLIILSVGIFAVAVITTTSNTSTSNLQTYDQTFTVTDNTVAQSLNTYSSGLTGIIVYDFNGHNTTVVNSAFVTYSGTTVTVAAGGLT